jgi:L,D-peptidoglycan transpeptidase YkuD (ErfK/YbiS/YcfS/YnhG family)
MAELTVDASGTVRWKGHEYRCALGRSGVALDKREGDGATPAGRFPLRQVLYRADRLSPPVTGLDIRPLGPRDAWCEDPGHGHYNRLVPDDDTGEHDRLWREDHIYDVVAPIGYNDGPTVPGQGSAIFLHVARASYTPTAGCVALALPDLLTILATADKETTLVVEPGGQPRRYG